MTLSTAKCKGNGTIVITIETCKRGADIQPLNENKATEITKSQVDSCMQQPEPKRQILPVVTNRLHGRGCALEINVLEKHEDNCTCKKLDNDKRNNIDDRVGSYDCIGRMVYRTCDGMVIEGIPSDVNTASVKGIINATDSAPNNNAKYKSPSKHEKPPAQQRTPVQSPSASPRGSLNQDRSYYSTTNHRASTDSTNQRNSSIQNKTLNDSATDSTKFTTPPDPAVESTVMALLTQPHDYRVKGPHYPGDNCRLRHPEPPILVDKQRLRKMENALNLQKKLQSAITSTKQFPTMVNQCHQFPSKTNTSFTSETVRDGILVNTINDATPTGSLDTITSISEDARLPSSTGYETDKSGFLKLFGFRKKTRDSKMARDSIEVNQKRRNTLANSKKSSHLKK